MSCPPDKRLRKWAGCGCVPCPERECCPSSCLDTRPEELQWHVAHISDEIAAMMDFNAMIEQLNNTSTICFFNAMEKHHALNS